LLRLLAQDAHVTSDDAPTYVAESDDRVVGMVTLCFFITLTGRKAYVDHLVVAPAYRRRGIGRALMRHAIERAEAAGASRIDLTANDRKQAGRALYESLGFEQRDTGSFRLHLGAAT
jgi:ribosomal protein S18 acetylase RimI-like enzyme